MLIACLLFKVQWFKIIVISKLPGNYLDEIALVPLKLKSIFTFKTTKYSDQIVTKTTFCFAIKNRFAIKTTFIVLDFGIIRGISLNFEVNTIK